MVPGGKFITMSSHVQDDLDYLWKSIKSANTKQDLIDIIENATTIYENEGVFEVFDRGNWRVELSKVVKSIKQSKASIISRSNSLSVLRNDLSEVIHEYNKRYRFKDSRSST